MRYLFIFLGTALALGSCSTNEEVITAPRQEIGFAAYNHKATRAEQPTELSDSYKIYASALWDNVKYFEGLTFEKTTTTENVGNEGEKKIWKAQSGTYYYPLSGSLNFMAYATNTKVPSASWNVTGKSVSLDFASAALDGTEDVLFSNLTDPIQYTNTAPVKLTFNHALAQICFAVKKSGSTVPDVVKITKITVKSVQLSGTASVTFANPSSSVTWSSLSDAADKELTASSGGVTANNTTAQDICSVLVPPQAAKNFTIHYTITNGGSESGDLSLDVTSVSGNWAAGTKYTYVIVINSLNEIKFYTEVSPWTDDSPASTDVTVPAA